MMQAPRTAPLSLIAHPACEVPDDWRVSVSIWRHDDRGEVNLWFALPRSGVQWPKSPEESVVPARTDRLWQHSCVELFVAVAGSNHYREFNFAADGRWAVYEFAGYRERVPRLPLVADPQISSEVTGDGLSILVTLSANSLPVGDEIEMNATAVLETETGSLSYWAASHPCAQPDFHDRAGFLLTLG